MNMIPKVIHYCWFGGKPLPKSVQKCIASWRKYFPDYEIKEWNESNFDVNMLPFTREAYAAKKYAFVSDVSRFWILYNEGGIYFDTDVLVLTKYDDILARGGFMGIELPSKDGQVPLVNPGLGIGAEQGNQIVKAILDYYSILHYNTDNIEQIRETVVHHTTRVLTEKFGLNATNEIQYLNGITIYPVDYFCPLNDNTGVLTKTANTHSIHWFAKSWLDQPMWYFHITRFLHRIFGVDFFYKIRVMLGANISPHN